MDQKNEIRLALNQALDANLPVADQQVWFDELVAYINRLILMDMNKLIYLLYRFDIDETQLKNLLSQQTQTDAALLIVGMLFKRQQEKNSTRSQYRMRDNPDIPEDEKW